METAEPVPLDHALVPVLFRHTRHVDAITLLEQLVDRHLMPEGVEVFGV